MQGEVTVSPDPFIHGCSGPPNTLGTSHLGLDFNWWVKLPIVLCPNHLLAFSKLIHVMVTRLGWSVGIKGFEGKKGILTA